MACWPTASQRLITIGLEVTKTCRICVGGVASMAGADLRASAGGGPASGVTTGMYYPAYSAMLPNVVEAAHLQAANGLKVSCGRCSTRPRAR